MSTNKTIAAITDFVFLNDETAAVDLALVLGSPSISNVEPAIALYRSGLTKTIVITGHGPSDASVPEWRAYRDHAVAAGVPAEHILIEPEARNTLENIVLSARIIAREVSWDRVSSIAICCKPVHARRAYMTARQHLPKHVDLLMLPPRHPADLQPEDWWATQAGKARVLGEIRRIAEYGLKEDLSIE